ncbi:hypothetical protein Trydic_g20337 [Trypoxylus dichotomus]
MAAWSAAQRLAAARIFALALPDDYNNAVGGKRTRDKRRPKQPLPDVWWVTADRHQARFPHSYDSESATVVIRSGTSDYDDDDDYDLDDEQDQERLL